MISVQGVWTAVRTVPKRISAKNANPNSYCQQMTKHAHAHKVTISFQPLSHVKSAVKHALRAQMPIHAQSVNPFGTNSKMAHVKTLSTSKSLGSSSAL